MRCPICQNEVAAEAEEFPFCSRRCRTRDLANWAEGVYRVPVNDEAPTTGAPQAEDDED